MNILVLSIEYPPVGGGAAPVIYEICKEYVRLGHQVTVVTMHHGSLPDKELNDGIEVCRVPSFRMKKHLSFFHEHIFFLLNAKKVLHGLMQNRRFDVCHTHFLVPTGILARWLKKKYGIPYMITCHGSDLPGFNPDRFYFLHKFTPPLIRSVIRESEYVTAPSDYLIALIQKVWGGPSIKLIRIANGINTDEFIPGPKKLFILSSGRLLPRKGFQFLIKAVSTLTLPAEVHICGDGPLRTKLEEMARESKTSIVFHGWLNSRGGEYKTLMQEASIYCLVSSQENASVALLEAMSSGCAVITSNVTGCPETVGDAGICIPPGQVQILQEKIKYLIDHPEEIQRLGMAAHKRAVADFDWKKIAEKYLALCNQMIST